jgi:hypothetical protein
MSSDAQADNSISMAWAASAYLAIRVTLDVLFFAAFAVTPGDDAIAKSANVLLSVSALLAPYCLIISFVMFRMSMRGHRIRAALAGFDSIVAAAVTAFAFKALM